MIQRRPCWWNRKDLAPSLAWARPVVIARCILVVQIKKHLPGTEAHKEHKAHKDTGMTGGTGGAMTGGAGDQY